MRVSWRCAAGALVCFLFAGACTNDFGQYSFSDTGGSSAGGSSAGGSTASGGSTSSGGANTGGSTNTGGASSCQGTQELCAGACVDVTQDPENCGACGQACPPGFACDGASCQCSQGDQCGTGFGAQCSNGGRCRCSGQSCEVGETCVEQGGQQRCSCNGGDACGNGQTCCVSGCVNLRNDEQNCGACGHVCPSGQSCNNGHC